ncbi:MAG: AAA family ATPase [Chitinophagaceae bacterium]|nr:AAA family ATPase [Chitinophagaceae bacterium]
MGLFKLKIYKNEILITSLTKESTNRNNSWFHTKNKDSYIKLPYTLIKENALLNLFKGLPPDMMELMKKSILTHLENNSSCHENQEMIHSEDLLPKSNIISYCFDVFLSGINNLGKYSKKSANIVNEETGYVEEVLYNFAISSDPKFKEVLPGNILEIIPNELQEMSISTILDLDAVKNYRPIPDELLYTTFSRLNFTSGNRGFQQIIYTKENNPYIFNLLREFDQNGDDGQFRFSRSLVNIFGIADSGADAWDSQISVSPLEDYGYVFKIGNKDSNHLSSLGYGMTQLIPLILNVSIHPEKTLIIEEPEANLHPSLQSKLADFFIDSLGRRDGFTLLEKDQTDTTIYTNTFIIETHSEYLIRKLQYLVAKGAAKTEDISIYYFQNNEIKSEKVKKININVDGSLSDDFGPGFIDEADKIALDLLILRNSQTN